MLHVCCVLTNDWPGSSEGLRQRCPDLGAFYVKTMLKTLTNFAPKDVEWDFTCFTDRPAIEGVTCRTIPKCWSWFAKLYLFCEDAFPNKSTVFFLDLDTCVTREWGPIARLLLNPDRQQRLTLLNDLWGPRRLATGLMGWAQTSDTLSIWRDFETNAERRPPYSFGAHSDIRTDEEWLIARGTEWDAFQDLLPGYFLSYKYHVARTMRAGGAQLEPLTPEAARAAGVIYFHGRPRPHEVRAPWNPCYVEVKP